MPPAAEGGTSVPDPDLISGQIRQVRSAASCLLEKAEKGSSVTDLAAAVEKATGALKLAAEMERAQGNDSERVRDYVALLTPLITIIILAATLNPIGFVTASKTVSAARIAKIKRSIKIVI